MKSIKSSGIRTIFLWLFFGIVIASIIPLTLPINGIIIYTPYVPFVALMLLLLFLKQEPIRVFRHQEEYIFISSQVLIVLLAMMSHDPSISLSASVVALYAIGLYWVVRLLLRAHMLNRSDLIFFAMMVFAILTIIAILQFIYKDNIGMVATYFGDNLEQGSYAFKGGQFRISSTFINPNSFSQVYVIYASILISVLLFYNRAQRLHTALIISGITTVVVATSLSRSGLLFALLVQMALYGFWISRGGKRKEERIAVLLVFIIGVLIAALITIPFVDDDLLPGMSRFNMVTTGQQAETRIVVYEGALQLLRDPAVLLFGTGTGQFYASMAEHGIYPDYKTWISPYENRGSVHNWILMVATQHGVIVLLLYAYAIYRTVSRGWFLRKIPGGLLPASLAIILATLYLTGLQLDTTGLTVWLLTPIVIMFAWIQSEYDVLYSQFRSSRKSVTDTRQDGHISIHHTDDADGAN